MQMYVKKDILATEQSMLLDNEIKKLIKEVETVWFSLKNL